MSSQFKMDAIYEEKHAIILRFVNNKPQHDCFGAHSKQSFDQMPLLWYTLPVNSIFFYANYADWKKK